MKRARGMQGCCGAAAAVILMLATSLTAQAAIVSRTILKSFFETGDKPTQEQFATLIDSALRADLIYGNTADEHAISLDHGQIALDATGTVRTFGPGETIDDSADFSGVGDDVQFNPLATGGAGIVDIGTQFESAGEQRFGFLQMSMDGAGSSTPYAIHLHYFVYDDTPGAAITTFFQPVPEPATLTLLSAAAVVILRRRPGRR